MGLIPRETQNNINQALKCLYSIDKSLGRIAEALEKQKEEVFVKHYTELGPIAETLEKNLRLGPPKGGNNGSDDV